MIKKLKNLRKFNFQAYSSLGKRLEVGGKLESGINLLINIAFKLKQKSKLKKHKLDSAVTSGCLEFKHALVSKNIDLFPKQILIIAELSIPQCTKYRVNQKLEMLQYLGKNVQLASWTDALKIKKIMQTSGAIIFYRVPAFEEVKQYFKLARHLGIITYFDLDDLIFDVVRLKENISLQHLNNKELHDIYNGAQLYYDAMMLADFGIASTTELAKEMRFHMQKEVFVVNNAIDAHSLKIIHSHKKTAKSNRIRIVYGSGTNTHNEDFKVAADAILMILAKYQLVDFVIYGYLDLDERFENFHNQIMRVPFVAANDYYRAIGNYDISIAPLTNNVFNDCKSNIKFLESALYKIACVCSGVKEFRFIIRDGENGYLAQNTIEWYEKLSKLIESEELRAQMANCAYNDVMTHYHWQDIANNQLQNILPKIKHNKKRILLVNLLFKPDSFGGATVVVENIANSSLCKEYAEILVFCGTFDNKVQVLELQRTEEFGISTIRTRINFSINREDEFNNHQLTPIFEQIVTAWQPDLVHFHSIQHLGANLAEVCIQQEIPYLITLHDAWWFCERQFMINNKNEYCFNNEGLLAKCASCVPDSKLNHRRRFYLEDICQKAKLLLTPSVFQKELYIEAGFQSEQLVVNKNGVLPTVNLITRKISDPSAAVVFAYLGGRAVHKGYYWLRDIFKQISGNYILRIVDIESRLDIVNDIEADWELGSKGKLEIVKYFEQTELDAFFSDVDVLLFPSLWKESFGLTIREAMLRDVWVVSTNCGGPAEDMVDGINGNVVEFGDKDGFRKVIENILADPADFKNYENKNKDLITTIDQQVDELLRIYKKVLGV